MITCHKIFGIVKLPRIDKSHIVKMSSNFERQTHKKSEDNLPKRTKNDFRHGNFQFHQLLMKHSQNVLNLKI